MNPHEAHPPPRAYGFTLLELIVVIAAISVLIGLVAPSLSTLGSTNLKTAGRDIANQFAAARSTAISEYKIHGLGIVTNDPANPSANFRQVAILRQDSSTGIWSTTTPRLKLPPNICFEPTDPIPRYFAGASYAVDDPSTLDSDYLLDAGTAVTIGGVIYRAFEYRPNGTAVTRPAINLKYHLLLTEVANPEDAGTAPLVYTRPSSTGAGPANWIHLSIDILTGRTQIHQP